MTRTRLTPRPSNRQAIIDALQSGKPDVAEILCREQLTLHPESIEHLRLLGHALMQQRRFEEAETQFKVAIKLAPDFPPLSEDLGSALAQQRKFEEAIPLFEQAVRQDPEARECPQEARAGARRRRARIGRGRGL